MLNNLQKFEKNFSKSWGEIIKSWKAILKIVLSTPEKIEFHENDEN